MFRRAFLLMAALAIGVSTPVSAMAQEIQGNWTFSLVTGGITEQTFAIVKLTNDVGKTKGELVASRPGVKDVALKTVVQDGPNLRLVLQSGTLELTFEGTLPKKAAKKIFGTMVVSGTAYPAWLGTTEQTTLDQKTMVRTLDCPPLQELRNLAIKVTSLRQKAAQSKDAEEKADILKQAAEADRLVKKETPRLYQEVLAKFADTPAVFDAALTLVRTAQTNGSKPEEVKKWAATATKAAQEYGPRWQQEIVVQFAAILLLQEAQVALALDLTHQAEKLLSPKAPPAEQLKVLNLLTRALQKTGKIDEAKKLAARINSLDETLDKEYLADLPLPKGEAFKGRTGTSERAVFLELFTGAMCPPCVAADLAFESLEKTYKHRDLVLIQYHMHIPGPDPLTNPDTMARWTYYTKAYPKQVGGVPSSIFNGKPAASGGGGTAQAEKKYLAYREVIEPLLEEPADAKISAKAVRKGDSININVEVTGVTDPNANKKLRILLAEEVVRYPGSNKIRLHHNVVRAFPGGVAGKSLTQAASKHQVAINLGELRGQLTKYLDNYELTTRPFSNPARPLDFNHLHVIAFVQDDDNRAILQAVQVGVDGK